MSQGIIVAAYPEWGVGNDPEPDLNIFYFIYMKRDWAEHRCYVKALSWQ